MRLFLESFISDVPVCRNADPVVLGVGNGEMVDVFCDVVANPNVDAFHWAFNNSAGLIHVPAGRATTQNGTRSKLTYTPRNNKDYGTLMCEAKNEVGKQKAPCIFHIILAGELAVFLPLDLGPEISINFQNIYMLSKF